MITVKALHTNDSIAMEVFGPLKHFHYKTNIFHFSYIHIIQILKNKFFNKLHYIKISLKIVVIHKTNIF